MQTDNIQNEKALSPYIPAIGAYALALGTTLGWGSLVDTGNIYLVKLLAKGIEDGIFMLSVFPECLLL